MEFDTQFDTHFISIMIIMEFLKGSKEGIYWSSRPEMPCKKMFFKTLQNL